MNIVLWVLQVLLALLFLFAGGTKVVLPIDVLNSMGSPNQVHLPGLFIRFIGVCEILGALGLLLPGLFRIRPDLTPLAAAALLVIMIGAVIVTIMGDGVGQAIVPFVVGLLLMVVAYGRWRLVPHQARFRGAMGTNDR
ncbi:MAG TPA: DoxX family protein [Pyrinomonadaceae bacterium]